MRVVIDCGGIQALKNRNSLDEASYSSFKFDRRGNCEGKVSQCNCHIAAKVTIFLVDYDEKQGMLVVSCLISSLGSKHIMHFQFT